MQVNMYGMHMFRTKSREQCTAAYGLMNRVLDCAGERACCSQGICSLFVGATESGGFCGSAGGPVGALLPVPGGSHLGSQLRALSSRHMDPCPAAVALARHMA